MALNQRGTAIESSDSSVKIETTPPQRRSAPCNLPVAPSPAPACPGVFRFFSLPCDRLRDAANRDAASPMTMTPNSKSAAVERHEVSSKVSCRRFRSTPKNSTRRRRIGIDSLLLSRAYDAASDAASDAVDAADATAEAAPNSAVIQCSNRRRFIGRFDPHPLTEAADFPAAVISSGKDSSQAEGFFGDARFAGDGIRRRLSAPRCNDDDDDDDEKDVVAEGNLRKPFVPKFDSMKDDTEDDDDDDDESALGSRKFNRRRRRKPRVAERREKRGKIENKNGNKQNKNKLVERGNGSPGCHAHSSPFSLSLLSFSLSSPSSLVRRHLCHVIPWILLFCFSLLLSPSEAENCACFMERKAEKLPPLYWNASNPFFASSASGGVLQVREGDKLNFICPHHPNGTVDTFPRVYLVTRREFDNCHIDYNEPLKTRWVFDCNRPEKNSVFTTIVKQFNPQPRGLQFEPCMDYYFITIFLNKRDSQGSQSGSGGARRRGGRGGRGGRGDNSNNLSSSSSSTSSSSGYPGALRCANNRRHMRLRISVCCAEPKKPCWHPNRLPGDYEEPSQSDKPSSGRHEPGRGAAGGSNVILPFPFTTPKSTSLPEFGIEQGVETDMRFTDKNLIPVVQAYITEKDQRKAEAQSGAASIHCGPTLRRRADAAVPGLLLRTLLFLLQTLVSLETWVASATTTSTTTMMTTIATTTWLAR